MGGGLWRYGWPIFQKLKKREGLIWGCRMAIVSNHISKVTKDILGGFGFLRAIGG